MSFSNWIIPAAALAATIFTGGAATPALASASGGAAGAGAAGGLLGSGASGAGGGLLGEASAAAGAETAAAPAWNLAAQEASNGGLGLDAFGWKGATAGLPGMLNTATSSAPGILNTAGRAASTAATVKSLMPQERPMPPAPPFQSGGGGGSVQGMYQNMQQNRLAQQQYEMQNRALRAQRLNSIG
jgi:hypothetical protein